MEQSIINHGVMLVAFVLIFSIMPGQDLSSRGEASAADIFFLDLGIVIEPSTGEEVYSRIVNPTSEEVKLRVKKVESGSVYMATSKEMLDALTRIQQRMNVLEKSFQQEMNSLQRENHELRSLIADITQQSKTQRPVANVRNEKPSQPVPAMPIPATEPQQQIPEETPDMASVDKVETDQESDESRPPSAGPESKPSTPTRKSPAPKFDYGTYMEGVFAYQGEDYAQALDYFEELDLEKITPMMAGNILYWMADAHQQSGNFYQAIELLDRVLVTPGAEERVDDALIKKGLLYRKTGQEEMALAAFSRLVKYHPRSEYVKLASMELKKADIYP